MEKDIMKEILNIGFRLVNQEIISTLEQYKYALVVMPIDIQIGAQNPRFSVRGYNNIEEAQEAARIYNGEGVPYSAGIYCYNAKEISRLSSEL